MSLRSAVASKYDTLGKNYKGGVVYIYIYLTLYEMFQMLKEIERAILSFLNLIISTGLILTAIRVKLFIQYLRRSWVSAEG